MDTVKDAALQLYERGKCMRKKWYKIRLVRNQIQCYLTSLERIIR